MNTTDQNTDAEFFAMLRNLANAHAGIARRELAELRGRGRATFIDERGAELDIIEQRLAKAATVKPCEGTLDTMHGLMRELEALLDSIAKNADGCRAELERWQATTAKA